MSASSSSLPPRIAMQPASASRTETSPCSIWETRVGRLRVARMLTESITRSGRARLPTRYRLAFCSYFT
jgi:hypothetical protein